MATFTLRLKDEEAKALDRLSYVFHQSKNQLITSLIAREYEAFISGEETAPSDSEILYISDDADFPREYAEGKDANEFKNTIIRCYNYAISKAKTDEEKDALFDGRCEYLDNKYHKYLIPIEPKPSSRLK